MKHEWLPRIMAGWLVLALTSSLRSEQESDALVGKWSWFTGGLVTIRADGSMVHDLGNDGTWERQDALQRRYTLRWRCGGLVDTITLSADGASLSGVNQLGFAVTASKWRAPLATQPGSVTILANPRLVPAEPVPAVKTHLPVDPAAEQFLQRGLSLFQSGKYAAALPPLLAAGKRGHARAQALLGRMYQEGLGVSVNLERASNWFGQAAARGHRAAQYALGGMYEEGEGVKKDVRKAVQLYEASAQQGFDKAQFALGLSYEFGQGVARNRQKAIYWLMQAAQQGDGRARWIADWLRRGDTPALRNEIELANHIQARMAPAGRAGGSTMPNLGAIYQKQEASRRAHEAEARGDHGTARIIREQNRIP